MDSLFGKKKKEQVKILSETEIQNKLYGKYRQPHTVVGHENEVPKEPDPATVPKPKQTSAPASQSADLFNPPLPEKKEPVPPPSSFKFSHKNSGELPKSQPASQIHSWVEGENRTLSQGGGKTSWNPAFRRIPQKAGRNVHDPMKIFRDLLPGILSIPVMLARGAASFIFRIDFKKSQIRNLAYWVGAGVFLGGIFLGIHLLNSQREKAMKSPPKVQAPAEVGFPSPEEPQTASPSVSKAGHHSRHGKKEAAPAQAEPADQKPAEEKKPVPTANPPAEVMKPYVVQVATYVGKNDAEKVAESFKAEGFGSFVQELKRQNGKVYYCVFLGRFKDYNGADAALSQFRKKAVAEPFQDAFVRSIGS